jgi:hypothetical protein
MQSETKKRLLLTALIFLSLGWALEEWGPGSLLCVIPYYHHTARDLGRVGSELVREYDSARTGPYGAFVREHIAAIGGVYALIGFLLLLKPSYRNAGWENLGVLFFGFMALVVWFVVGDWISVACREINHAHGGHWAFQRGLGSLLISIVTGITWPLLTIALGLTLWVGVPLYLLVLLISLPSIVYDLLRFLVRLPLLTYHYLHYITVPHPAETAYRAGIAEHLPIPELARSVVEAMYRSGLKDFDALPPE